jgi:hypothetical protein
MSDDWLRLIPTEPEYQPTTAAAERARELLVTFVPDARQVAVAFKPTVQFFHPGLNWSGVRCSACGADAQNWWEPAMTAAAEHAFSNLRVKAACCATELSLNDLCYPWAAGFARFVIEMMNPNISALTADELELLGVTLGCELRTIWVHL